jgi:2-dehydro-3-deoxyphosphogluconate aldolase/(4S)-4-hydroxy-2-oxoglutarate aldolase
MLYPHSEATVAVLRRAPVIPVLTVKDVEDALAQTRALIAGGLLVLEITLRTPAAMGAVSALAKTFPDACIGAGRLSGGPDPPRRCRGGVSGQPRMSPRLLEAAVQSPVPLLPGAATASETMALRERGFRALKFFPAEPAAAQNIPASLALPDLIFCPTAVSTWKVANYLGLANVACVGGSWDGFQPRLRRFRHGRTARTGSVRLGCRC